MGEFILLQVLSYLIGLASGIRTDALLRKHAKKLNDALDQGQREIFALTSQKALKDRLADTAGKIGDVLASLEISKPIKEAFTHLLLDPIFREDLALWLSFWDLPESIDARARIESSMKIQLDQSGINQEVSTSIAGNFFNLAETVIFADPILSRWRHQLSLNAIQEKHEEIIRRLRERDGEYDESRLNAALNKYREEALKAHDIIDVQGLPEDDRRLVMEKFVMRQLYIPLRVNAEPLIQNPDDERSDKTLKLWEAARRTRQRILLEGSEGLHESDQEKSHEIRLAVGDLLKASRLLVILADPGGGKTTLMRWFATAYLLRLMDDPQLASLPDASTLPDADWLPILIRCRELPRDPIACAFDDLLVTHINQLILEEKDRKAVKALFVKRLQEGTAFLMIDGLDEIQDPMLRSRFSRRIETLATLFKRAPMLITSRIVGYREMAFRLGKDFRHCTITDLTREDMDEFARRWAIATEPEIRHLEVTRDLINNIHSSERVERLAGNPMLLTTLALVHRKIGRLPQKRHALYREALGVLLNWRGDIDERLDWDEAVPQLEYLAYTMCRDGVQQIPRDGALSSIEEMRTAYGNRIRDVNKRQPEEFLQLLERRSSLLIEAGHKRIDGRVVTLYEFRHLTFQEYLAALALVDGRFPGHEKGVRFPARVAPLAAICNEQSKGGAGNKEMVTSENWREPLRLCLAECDPDDVDDALLAILHPLKNEDSNDTARPRAVMAALCLADEPNIIEDTATEVIHEFVKCIGSGDGAGQVRTALDAAAIEIGRRSSWKDLLQDALLDDYLNRAETELVTVGGLCGMIGTIDIPDDINSRKLWMESHVDCLSKSDKDKIRAALSIMNCAYLEKAVLVEGLIDSLNGLLNSSVPMRHAVTWALCWLSGAWRGEGIWKPSGIEIEPFLNRNSNLYDGERSVYFSLFVLGRSRDPRAYDLIISFMRSENERVRHAAISAIGYLGDVRAVQPLLEQIAVDKNSRSRVAESLSCLGDKAIKPLTDNLNNHDRWVRMTIVEALANCHKLNRIQRILLTKDLDGVSPWIDPRDPIKRERIKNAEKKHGLSEHEIVILYEELTRKFHLNFNKNKLRL